MDKKARNNGKTSVKNAWPVYVLGIILLTWGILTALSFWAPAGKNGSVLFLIRRTVLWHRADPFHRREAAHGALPEGDP